jgi:peptide deformylase
VVTVFDDSLAQTAKEMLLIMYAAEGVGLAAPQVCWHKKWQFAYVHRSF